MATAEVRVGKIRDPSLLALRPQLLPTGRKWAAFLSVSQSRGQGLLCCIALPRPPAPCTPSSPPGLPWAHLLAARALEPGVHSASLGSVRPWAAPGHLPAYPWSIPRLPWVESGHQPMDTARCPGSWEIG